MRITARQTNFTDATVTPAEAVTYVAHRAEMRHSGGGVLEGVRARAEAVEAMLGQLLTVLIDNGALRAQQVEQVLDYDVSVEN